MKKTLKELAEQAQCQLIGDPAYVISGVDELESAGPEDASFLANPRYRPLLEKTHAGVICIQPEEPRVAGKNYLLHPNPSAVFQQLLVVFLGAPLTSGFSGIHPSAVVHPSAKIGQNVTIGPHAVIDQDAHIGDHTTIGAGTVIGPAVQIGTHCLLHANVTVRERCKLGNRVIIQSGAVIGSCGFGYNTDAEGKHIKQDHFGIVTVEDDVEIGANTTIDRGAMRDTVIGEGSKIDNLVQIGHNVTLGRHCIIVSQTGISGSTVLGDYVVMGGQVGVGDHLTVGDGAQIGARGGVMSNVPAGARWAGMPAEPGRDWLRGVAKLRQLTRKNAKGEQGAEE
ncbi:MAG: UDP-3-O-(3-hydroxymyristoyl)glucosamine N-acyltransferase [Verrucomicrobia bacterium]|nr:UDP-3-O-(3-hydroxymyristoyl)glucosamine N-acyltransferase [Verrucomicrobiota bacterium]